jgi:tight adherence protein B
MSILIYFSTFISILVFLYLLSTYIAQLWRNWQNKQIENVSYALSDNFIFPEKKKILLFVSSPLIFSALGLLALGNIFGFILGFLLGFGFPGVVIMIARSKRIKKLQSQLVDTLMILSSSLRGGLSFVEAVEVACEEMPAPISEELGLVLKQNKLGKTLEESLISLRERLNLEEISLMVSAILVAKETGGELTKVLSRLVETIRDNVKLKEKIATLTLQGRLQGLIMAFLPIVFTFFVYKQDPHHFDVMFQTELGRLLLIGAVLAQLLGMYMIKRISSMKI